MNESVAEKLDDAREALRGNMATPGDTELAVEYLIEAVKLLAAREQADG